MRVNVETREKERDSSVGIAGILSKSDGIAVSNLFFILRSFVKMLRIFPTYTHI